MSDRKLRVVLAAEESAGVQTLRTLVKSMHDIVMVLTSTDSNGVGTASVAGLAARSGCRIEPAVLVKDPAFADTLREERVDLLLNVHSLYLANGAVVDAPAIGSFNLHPGPLPEYAGLNCPSWAIYNDEPEHGVTLHWMTSGVDTGDIAYLARFPLTPKDTGLTVSAKCVRQGLPLIVKLLDAAAQDHIPRIKQDLAMRQVYKRKDIPHEGRIDWRLPAKRIDSFVRAADYHPLSAPWGHPLAALGEGVIGIVKVEVTGQICSEMPGSIRRTDQGVWVATGDQWLALRLIHQDGSFHDPADIIKTDGLRFAA
jgi:UDP-4-amino-4-deoxy-L-arabinose formyltransferase/UDP-glucuronic acid dehydrogenase (UDP-4-keto-hexauronic acid decarboxylating)